MAKRVLETAVILGAKDEMSSVVANAVSKAKGSLAGLSGGSNLMKGLVSSGVGYQLASGLSAANEEYKKQEYSLANLRVLAMERGKVNEELYGREEKFVTELSRLYSKSKDDYAKMFAIGLTNRISPEDMMGGVGENAAKLAKVFDNMEPDKAMLFFARLKNDLRVSNEEMGKMANVIFKEKNLGVGINAEDTVQQLTEAYAKAGLGATNLGLQGAKDAEELGILMGVFIAKGISGQTVGNNFRRIFDGIRDPEKMNKVLNRGAEYGIKMNFYDENGKFTVKHFEQELAKLSKVSTQARAYILNPFSGKQGLSTDFLEYLAKYGEDIGVFENQYANVADLNDAVKELQNTLMIQESVLETNKVNLKATFGKAMAQDVRAYNSLMNKVVLNLDGFVSKHPQMARMTGEFIAMAAGAASLYGGLSLVGGYIPVLGGLLTTLNANGIWATLGGLGASLIAINALVHKGADVANSGLAKDPNSKLGQNTAFFNKKIAEAEDPNNEDSGASKFLQASWWRFRKVSHGAHAWLGGMKNYEDNTTNVAAMYDAHERGVPDNVNRAGARYYNEKNKDYNSSLNAGASNSLGAWKSLFGMGNSTITYSPQITITGNSSMTKEDFQTVLRGNVEELLGLINREQRRQGSMTYGNR